VVGFALLSVWAAYRLQRDNDVLLGPTPLQEVIAAKIVEGNALVLRLRQIRAAQVPEALTAAVASWASRTNRDLHEVAPEVGERFLSTTYSVGLESRDPREQREFVQNMLRGLEETRARLRRVGLGLPPEQPSDDGA
jgi:hypothetical protein